MEEWQDLGHGSLHSQAVLYDDGDVDDDNNDDDDDDDDDDEYAGKKENLSRVLKWMAIQVSCTEEILSSSKLHLLVCLVLFSFSRRFAESPTI